ncbi:MAG TPA: hypothetical protein VD788_07460, partial [Candidatus Polarisedimenticolaceae bacterium]|nr:hypothetical protein [Candidatus Polarisedimenticolaceae bacterium]
MGPIDERRALDHLIELLSVEGPSGGEHHVSQTIRARARAAGCPAASIIEDDAHLRIGDGFRTGNLIIRMPGT